MKKTSIILILSLVLCILSACNSMEKPETAVTNAFTALKNMDVDAMGKYFEYASLMTNASLEKTVFTKDNIQSLLLTNLECKPVSAVINGDIATVTTEITNIDMKTILPIYYSEINRIAFDKTIPKEENYISKYSEQFLQDAMKDPNVQKITSTVDIALTKNNNNWSINISDDKLVNALLGDLLTAASSTKKIN